MDVLIEERAWEPLGLGALADQATNATFRQIGLEPDQFEISLLACDDSRIAALNGNFRDKARPTNVLSWPSGERAAISPGGKPDLPEPGELGDIAIAYQFCAREAEDIDKPMAHHIIHLLLHGILHLLGYDHIDAKDAALMEGLEVKILESLGLPDPY